MREGNRPLTIALDLREWNSCTSMDNAASVDANSDLRLSFGMYDMFYSYSQQLPYCSNSVLRESKDADLYHEAVCWQVTQNLRLPHHTALNKFPGNQDLFLLPCHSLVLCSPLDRLNR